MKAHPENLGTALVVQVSTRRYRVAIAYTIVDGTLVCGFDSPTFQNRATAVSRANEINTQRGKDRA